MMIFGRETEKKIHELLGKKKLFPVQDVRTGKKERGCGRKAGGSDRKNDGKENDLSHKRERPEKQ